MAVVPASGVCLGGTPDHGKEAACNASFASDFRPRGRPLRKIGPPKPVGSRAWVYSTLFVPDHFNDQLAPVPALMAAAYATSTLRIGTLVLDNDYRHPLVLAKEFATLDVLSGGRVEVGIGAGWMVSDYEQSGIAFESPGVRIGRLEETVKIMKGLFLDGSFSFSGAS